MVEEAAGNPLALIEFAAAQRPYHSAAGPMPVSERVLASFRSRIATLPEKTRLMMLTLAAEGRGHLPTLLGGAAARGPLRHAAVLVAAAADQVEAAVRLGEPERAAEPLRRLEAWAQAGGQPWAQAVSGRCRALVSGDEADYVRALEAHERAGRPFEQARTELLYGEWLRRAKRRGDARARLRSALTVFERLGAAPWLDRARAELHATGETLPQAEPAAANLLDRLTSQELHVVRLAVEGGTSREIAAKLFLSPRTVEHHLYRAFRKLGVRSRRELARLDIG